MERLELDVSVLLAAAIGASVLLVTVCLVYCDYKYRPSMQQHTWLP